MPPGFLGTRADLLMDLVIVAFVVILPLLCLSWWRVRGGRYATHKRLQLGLFTVLFIAVLLFELNLKLSGGIFELTAASAYSGTPLLNAWIYSHTIAAVLTSIIWVILVILSLRRFDVPPVPNGFSRTHRFWGRIGMVGMLASGLSSFPLYYYGFAL